MTFEQIVFEPHPMVKEVSGLPPHLKEREIFKDLLDAKQAFYKSDCGLTFSILLGNLFYSNGKDTYEIWIGGDTPLDKMGGIYQEPMGHLNERDVLRYIRDACEDYTGEWKNKDG